MLYVHMPNNTHEKASMTLIWLQYSYEETIEKMPSAELISLPSSADTALTCPGFVLRWCPSISPRSAIGIGADKVPPVATNEPSASIPRAGRDRGKIFEKEHTLSRRPMLDEL